MSLAAIGFITGLAKGTTERIKKEREENEIVIENRFKLAAANKLKRENEVSAMQKSLNDRYETVSAYLPADATEEQKLALISNDMLAKEYTALRSKGEEVDLNKFITINKDKIPTSFTSVRSYIDQLTAAPKPMTSEQAAAAGEGRKLFGGLANTSIPTSKMDKLASQYGGASAAELLSYENVKAPSDIYDVGRVNAGFLAKPKSIDTRIEEAGSGVANAIEKFGPDSQEAIDAVVKYSNLEALKKVLDPKQVKFTDMVDKAKIKVATAETPEEVEAAKQNLNKLLEINKKGESAITQPQTVNLFKTAVSTAVGRQYPMLGKNLEATPDRDTGTVSYRYIGADPVIGAKIENTKLAAIKGMYIRYFSDADGMPTSENVKMIMQSMGVDFAEDGRPIFSIAVPEQKEKTNPNVVGTPTPKPSAAATPPVGTPTPKPSAAASKPSVGTQTSRPQASGKVQYENIDESIAAIDREIAAIEKQMADPSPNINYEESMMILKNDRHKLLMEKYSGKK